MRLAHDAQASNPAEGISAVGFRAGGAADAAFVGLTCVVGCEKGGLWVSSAVLKKFGAANRRRMGDGGAGVRVYPTYSVTRTLLTLS